MQSFITAGEINECRFVKFAQDGGIVQAENKNDNIIGISETVNAHTHDTMDVALNGETALITAGGVVAAGDRLTTNADGKAVVATDESYYAIALESAAAEDETIKAIVSIVTVPQAEEAE